LMVKYIRYKYKPVEELTKAIAYVTKENVDNILKNKEPLLVSELKYTEENTPVNIESPTDKITQPIENKSEVQESSSIVIKNLLSDSNNITLIEKLIACDNGDELHALLDIEENKNNLIFSWDSKSYRKNVSSENFYIALIDPNDNKIVGFLDKGKSERKDLKNQQRIINIGLEDQNIIQVWIQLL
jgi:hypothetical protein